MDMLYKDIPVHLVTIVSIIIIIYNIFYSSSGSSSKAAGYCREAGVLSLHASWSKYLIDEKHLMTSFHV